MTRFAEWPTWVARLVLLAALALVLSTTIQRNYVAPTRNVTDQLPMSDGALYAKIVDRVQAGEDYYAAAADQHRKYGYPTAPANVFREPWLAMLLAALPGKVARWGALMMVVFPAVFAARSALQTTSLSPMTQLAAVLAMATGLSNAGMPNAPYMHEVWASALMVLSLSAYQLKRPLIAAVFALAACLFRELALPFVLAMGFVDLLERRWRNVAIWSAVVAAFAAIYGWHLHQASDLHRAGDLPSSGWLGLGGWPFLLLTARRNAALLLTPTWVVAIVVVGSVLGLLGCRDRWISRIALIVCGYLAAITVVGRIDNEYWGELWAPLLAMGATLAPAALMDLGLRAAGLPRQEVAKPNLEENAS